MYKANHNQIKLLIPVFLVFNTVKIYYKITQYKKIFKKITQFRESHIIFIISELQVSYVNSFKL